jgi:hypothetical protein
MSAFKLPVDQCIVWRFELTSPQSHQRLNSPIDFKCLSDMTSVGPDCTEYSDQFRILRPNSENLNILLSIPNAINDFEQITWKTVLGLEDSGKIKFICRFWRRYWAVQLYQQGHQKSRKRFKSYQEPACSIGMMKSFSTKVQKLNMA